MLEYTMFEISFALSFTDTGKPRRRAIRRRSAFARFTRYSASDIAPAIATAIVSSSEKIFWTTFDPMKNPFDARLSAASTTPSLLRMPTVVVISYPGPLMPTVEYVDSNGRSSVTLNSHYLSSPSFSEVVFAPRTAKSAFGRRKMQKASESETQAVHTQVAVRW